MYTDVKLRRWATTLAVAFLLTLAIASAACTKTPGGVTEPPTEPTVTVAATQVPATVNTPPTLAPLTVAPATTTPPTATPTASPSLINTPTPEPTAAPTATPLPDGPLVHIGKTVYQVDLALTGEEKTQGLSRRPSLADNRGMLFVYDEDAPRAFWMPYMNFPLDMVWIRADCTVAGVTADVPHPDPATPLSDLPHYPSSEPARFVLEINAGQAATYNIIPDSPVTFGGQIAGEWGC